MNKSIIYKATEDKDIQEDLRKLEALQKELKALEQKPCEDAISRQALLKLMGEEPFNWTDSDEELQAVEDYRNFRNMVEQLPSVNPQDQKWIPVSERLPKIATVYRVTRCYPNNVMNPYYLVDACFFDGSNTWYNDNRINHERAYVDNVIAWQENPEPFEPQESEG